MISIKDIPIDLKNKTILDVGCWEGTLSIECINNGADSATGVDLCVSPQLKDNLSNPKFDFYQIEISGEKFLQLPSHDIVFCCGVLYHVEDVFNTLTRLKSKTLETLVIETVFHCVDDSQPLMLFHKNNSLRDNPTNWWSVNELCMTEMLETLGFDNIKFFNTRHYDNYDDKGLKYKRSTVVARNTNNQNLEKIHSRKLDKMEVFGGNRKKLDKN
jgi:SAM-dependent methyltransferase